MMLQRPLVGRSGKVSKMGCPDYRLTGSRINIAGMMADTLWRLLDATSWSQGPVVAANEVDVLEVVQKVRSETVEHSVLCR